MSRYYIAIPKSQAKPMAIQVISEDDNNPINILDVSANVPFLSVETDGKTEIKIEFKEGVEIVSSYYSVTAKIENDKKRSLFAKMTVNVTSDDK
jgi:hypothetical protein